MHRIVTIIVTGRPFDLNLQDISSGGTQDLGMRTEPFDSRWHCPLDLMAMAQQSIPRPTRAPSTVSPSTSVGPNRDVYPVPPSPFPSVMSQKRNSGAPQPAGNPFAGPLSSSTPDGSSYSSIFGGAPELPSATVAGSKRHTIAGLASLAAKRASLPQTVNQRASTPMMVPPALSLNSPRFVPTPPSVAVAASANLTPSVMSGSIHSQSTPKDSPIMGGLGLAPSLSGPTGHTPVTPAFPAYPDIPLPSTPLSQAPMQGLVAALAPSLDIPPPQGSLSEPPIRGLRQVQHAPPVLQPVLVSVSLLPPESGSDECIYPMDTFSLEVFVFNESDVVRRCEISCPAKKRWRQEAAERHIEESSGGQAGIFPLENHIRIGPLRPGTCQSVRMRFLAVQAGVYTVDTLTLTDTETGFATNLKDVMNVVVHRREEPGAQDSINTVPLTPEIVV
ncbi:hypothetical protein FS749_007788 [Ceratobasidium sp. UAMH 11750]|nr:hypothetical protein FS749_007788 [Ceratobasidium sp. UAMH 11750]